MSENNQEGVSFENELDHYSRISKGAFKKSQGMGVAVSSVAALAVCTNESEAVMTIITVDEPILNTGPAGALLLDVDGDTIVDFEFQGDNDSVYPFVKMGVRNGIQVLGRNVGGYNYASRLGMSALVSGAGSFLPADPAVDKLLAFQYFSGGALVAEGGDWLAGNTGFIGFQVPNGADVNYGWVEVAVNADNSSGTVIRYGIESEVNTPALAGTGVPEPNSLACLALGAAGLLGWRQRRKSA